LKKFLAVVALCGIFNPAFADGLTLDFATGHPTKDPATAAELDRASTNEPIAKLMGKNENKSITLNYSKMIMSENCPCKTPQGKCRYDSSGKPAGNC
jgi:hypothetical protein